MMNETTQAISRLLGLAIDAEEANETESAGQLYARCLELDNGTDSSACHPGYPPVRLCASRRAAAFFFCEQRDARAALQVAERAVQRWPADAGLHSLIGRCYKDLKELDRAEAAYRQSLAIEQKTWTLSALAEVLRLQRRDDEALACLHAVLELDPDYEEAHANIGYSLRLKGEYSAAIDSFQKAIAIDPDYAWAHAELGFALMRAADKRDNQKCAEQHRLALDHLKRSVALDPEYHWSRIYLANLLSQLERTREAREHYEAAVRLRPDDAFVLAFQANFLSDTFGPSTAAEVRFKKAIELDPENASVRYWYGQHLLRAKRYTEARRELMLADRLGHARALEELASAGTDDDEL
jgi:tetratricopeptide (TPR) repeat protein